MDCSNRSLLAVQNPPFRLIQDGYLNSRFDISAMCFRVTHLAVKQIASMALKFLGISNGKDLDVVEYLTPLASTLRALDLSRSHANNDHLQHFTNFTNLTFLNLAETNIDSLAPLSKMIYLTSLNVWGCQIKDEDLAFITPMTMMRNLNLGSCDEISDAGLKFIENMPFLEDLQVSCELITGSAFKEANWPNLTSLSLSSSQLQDKNIQYFENFPKLSALYLQSCEEITGIGFKGINLLNLTELYLDECCNLSDEGLEPIASFTNLTKLSLEQCSNCTDEGVKPLISNLNRLKYFNINRLSKVTNESFQEITKLTNLAALSFSGTQVNDDVIDQIAQLTKLINIFTNPLTELNLSRLANMPYMEHLSLYGNNNFKEYRGLSKF